jgi:hypothetical protein
MYSTSILLDADVGLMERYLQHPPREPDYRRSRPHAAFVRVLGGGQELYERLATALLAAPPG